MKPNVEIEELRLGDGPAIERGWLAVVDYVGRLHRGDVFATSERDGQKLRFVVGRRAVVAGLDYGMVGMRVGGARRITVPPHLGYRENGIPGVVPPNAIMIFDVELLEAHPPKAE